MGGIMGHLCGRAKKCQLHGSANGSGYSSMVPFQVESEQDALVNSHSLWFLLLLLSPMSLASVSFFGRGEYYGCWKGGVGSKKAEDKVDAGTWVTMVVGLGYSIAAAVASPNPLVVAVKFRFSAMEVEIPVVVIVFNNGGVYGDDWRIPEEISGPYKDDTVPT